MTGDRETAELETGSDNVFADLALDDAPELKLKAEIVGQINLILQQRKLTQADAAEMLGITQPKVSALKHGRLRGFSLEKLLNIMVRLDRDVEIRFEKRTGRKDATLSVKLDMQRDAHANSI